MKFWVVRNGQPTEVSFSEMKSCESGFATREELELDIVRTAERAGKPPIEMVFVRENPGRMCASRNAPEINRDQDQVDEFLRTV